MPQPTGTVARIIRLVDTNKAKAAFLAPFAVTLVGVIVNWAATGEFDTGELKLAAEGIVASIVSGGAVYKTPAKQAVVAPSPSNAPSPGVPGVV
jgi:hypothetical protein